MVNEQEIKKAEEAARAYADVLENHMEHVPVQASRFGQNDTITAGPDSGIVWQKSSAGMMELVEQVFPYKGIRSTVEEIIREYRRRARNHRGSEASDDSDYDANRTIAYNGTQPCSEYRARNRTSAAERTQYAGASLKVVHDALCKAYELPIGAQPVWFQHQVRVAVEVYGFRIQQDVVLDEWLEPKLVPLNAGILGELEGRATCKVGAWNHKDDIVPSEGCSCGFYSVAHPKYLDAYMFKGKKGRHIGLVSQHWGKIIVGRDYNNEELVHGYRSEYQTVLCVVSNSMSYTVETALMSRGVQVYRGYENMRAWWEDVGKMRFDGLVDDAAYGEKKWNQSL